MKGTDSCGCYVAALLAITMYYYREPGSSCPVRVVWWLRPEGSGATRLLMVVFHLSPVPPMYGLSNMYGVRSTVIIVLCTYMCHPPRMTDDTGFAQNNHVVT